MPEITGPSTVDSPFTRFGEQLGLRPVPGDTTGGFAPPLVPNQGTVGQLVGDLDALAADAARAALNAQSSSVVMPEQWRADP